MGAERVQKREKIIRYILSLLLFCFIIVEPSGATTSSTTTTTTTTTKMPKLSSILKTEDFGVSEPVRGRRKHREHYRAQSEEHLGGHFYPVVSQPIIRSSGKAEEVFNKYPDRVKASLEVIMDYLNENYQPFRQPNSRRSPSRNSKQTTIDLAPIEASRKPKVSIELPPLIDSPVVEASKKPKSLVDMPPPIELVEQPSKQPKSVIELPPPSPSPPPIELHVEPSKKPISTITELPLVDPGQPSKKPEVLAKKLPQHETSKPYKQYYKIV